MTYIQGRAGIAVQANSYWNQADHSPAPVTTPPENMTMAAPCSKGTDLRTVNRGKLKHGVIEVPYTVGNSIGLVGSDAAPEPVLTADEMRFSANPVPDWTPLNYVRAD